MSEKSHWIVDREHAAGVYDIRISGIPVWRLVRDQILERYLIRKGELSKSNHNRVRISDFPAISLGIVRSLVHLVRIRRKRYLIIGFPRRRLVGSRWVDPLSDPVIDALGADNVLCIEKTFGGRHASPAYTANLVHYDWVTALSMMLSWVLGSIMVFVHARAIRRLAVSVERVTGDRRTKTAFVIARAYAQFRVERMLSVLLLYVVKPSRVLLSNKRSHYPTINACKARGIPVIELQHGVASVREFKSGREYDPSLDPDLFLTWGPYWNDSEWGIPRENVRTAGFKFLADMRERIASSDGDGRRDRILLISQPHHGGKLADWFSEIVRRHEDRDFILKLHPQDIGAWERRYPFGNASNVRVVAGGSPDIYELFGRSSVALGLDSTVLFEASYFGLNVGFLDLDGSNRCAALKFSGRYNFYAIRSLEDVATVLSAESGVHRGAEAGNPFFSAVDNDKLRALVEAA